MKQFIAILVLTTILLGITGCSKESNPTPTSAMSNTTSDVNTIDNITFTETLTKTGIMIETKHYSVTLPAIWNNEYAIEYSANQNGGYALRFKDKVSYEAQGFGGHIFTLSLDPAMGETLKGFYLGGKTQYCGGLHVDQTKLFTLSAHFPTDVQFISERAELYQTLHNTFQAVLDTFTPATNNSIYYPVGVETFEQRAKLTTHAEKGQEVIGKFTADENIELTYLGIALEPLTYDPIDDKDGYGFHVYIPKDGTKTYYCVPFEEIDGTLDMVYQMTDYPNIEKIWTYEAPERKAYRNFLRGLASSTKDPDSLGYYVFHDLDNDGTQELLIDNDCVLTIYKYQGNYVNPLDSYDFQTGTIGFYYPNLLKEDGTPYHQLFTRYTGGGQNHHGMLTLENNKLVHTPLWDENFASVPDYPPITEHTNNQELIEASKKATITFEFYSIKKYFVDLPKE